MIRTLIFMGLMAMNMLMASCFFICRIGQPLDQTVRETLELVKKETRGAIILTTEKVKRNEVDVHVGNEIIGSLTENIKQMDSLIAVSVQVGKIGYKEKILQLVYYTDQFTKSAMTNLRSLRDLYDISTCSQFETTTFFPVDSFNIPPDKIDGAKKAIEPVARRIVRFCDDHPRQKFEVVIACVTTADSEEPKDKLSVERGRSIAYLLVNQIRSYEESIPHPAWIHYNITWLTKGETLANSGSKKLSAPEDRRGNVVSLAWSILPSSYAGASNH